MALGIAAQRLDWKVLLENASYRPLTRLGLTFCTPNGTKVGTHEAKCHYKPCTVKKTYFLDHALIAIGRLSLCRPARFANRNCSDLRPFSVGRGSRSRNLIYSNSPPPPPPLFLFLFSFSREGGGQAGLMKTRE